MEWRWVKTLLIILFLVLNCFLSWKVYQRNTTSAVKPEAVLSLESIFKANGIQCSFNMNAIGIKKYMRKINISNGENIKEEFIPLSVILSKDDIKYSGRNREILDITYILANFVRDTKINNVNISNISLGYYPEINQIDKNILSAEAMPAWLIELDNGQKYVYNAYLGKLIV